MPILRHALAHAGAPQPDAYSGHSFRRGFASWATANGWDIKSLMAYVGWRRADTAMRYVDADTPPFMRVSATSSSPPSLILSTLPVSESLVSTPLADLVVQFSLASYTLRSRQRAKARQLIEEACLARHRAQREDTDCYCFQLQIADNADLEHAIATVLDDMYRIADNHACYLNATISDREGPRHWA